LSALARKHSSEKTSPWNKHDAFGFGGARETSYAVSIDGKKTVARLHFGADGVHATIEGKAAADCRVIAAGESVIAWHGGRQTVVMPQNTVAAGTDHGDNGGIVIAPMHGKVLAIEVRRGDRVSKGQPLAVIEAMKMEHALASPMDGEVIEITVAVGDQVAERARLIVIAVPETAEP
jgi:3-methylcrotonyl-CoA carboxylase alpha subunit